METNDMAPIMPFLNQSEASILLESVKDRITWQLLAMLQTDIAMTVVIDKKFPAAPVDLLFVTEVMLGICSAHDSLRTLLAARDEHGKE